MNYRQDARWIRWCPPLLIAVVTFIVFLPALQNGFVWDDKPALLANPGYRGLGWTQLKWMWSTFYFGSYRPLTWMTYGADYVVWGMKPAGYHLTNLLLHVVNAVLVYFLARRVLALVGGGPAKGEELGFTISAVGAALVFAIHPLRVEPVAWVSARADVLAALCLFLSVLAYLKYGGGSLEAFGLYWLSLMAKPVGLSLPVVLVVLDVYPLRRLGGGPGRWIGRPVWGVWGEKVLFLGVAFAAALMAFLSKFRDTSSSTVHYSLTERIQEMTFGLAFHLWKTLVPFGLSPLYERPLHLDPFAWPFLLSATAVLGLTGLLILGRRRWPAGLAAWACYLALLLPTSGIIHFGWQIAADRFTYVSCLPLALLAGGGLWWTWRAWQSRRLAAPASFAIAGLTVAALGGLGTLTVSQLTIWHNEDTLWT